MAVKKSARVDARTARLLDANLNRAREGLRVVEDTVRFLWNDKKNYERFRGLRHELHDLTRKSYKILIAARDSVDDVGREIKETGRSSVSAVVSANLRRAQEAVRVLEEYGKVFSRGAAEKFKRIRYRLYQEEKKVLKKL